MTSSGSPRAYLRITLAVTAFGVFGLMLLARRNAQAFATLDPVPRYVLGAIAICGLAWGGWRVGRPMGRRATIFGWLLVAPLVAATAFGYVREARRELGWRRVMRPERVDAIRRLRLLIASQEDNRLTRGSYSDDAHAPGVGVAGDEQMIVRADADRGWWAKATSMERGYSCRVFVRGGADSPNKATDSEGIPVCDGGDPVTAANNLRRELPAARYIDGAVRPVRITGDNWSQYRRDEFKSGRCCAGGGRFNWTVHIGSEIRTTPAIAGDVIVVGAHGTGEIVALDRRDGRLLWRSRAPNWIHNDPVIADGVVFFGFGNSEASPILGVLGSPPSGVAAFDLATGRRVWTHLVDGAVMTSPVIASRVLAFVSSDGRAYAVDVRTGERKWSAKLPLQAAMVNPALADSTLYVEAGTQTCAVDLRTGRIAWCSRVPSYFEQRGEAEPNSVDSTFVVTSVEDSAAAPLKARFGWGVRSTMARVWRRWTFGRAVGHRYAIGLARRDGAVRWVVDLGSGGRPFGGDLGGGAASVENGVAYIVSPRGGTISAIDMRLGRRVWQQPLAGLTRGPPAIIGGLVTITYSDGTVNVLSAATGTLACAGMLGVPSDRAGATIAGQTAYVTGVNGRITAIPVDEFVACRFGARQKVSPTATHTPSHDR